MFKKKLLTLLLLICVSTIVFSQSTNYKLIVFEGSDWCANCIRFNKTIVSNELFSEFTQNENITVEHIDFPQRKKLDATVVKYNAEIAEKYNFDGSFPTILLVNTKTNQYEKIRYKNEQVDEFVSRLKQKITSTK